MQCYTEAGHVLVADIMFVISSLSGARHLSVLSLCGCGRDGDLYGHIGHTVTDNEMLQCLATSV